MMLVREWTHWDSSSHEQLISVSAIHPILFKQQTRNVPQSSESAKSHCWICNMHRFWDSYKVLVLMPARRLSRKKLFCVGPEWISSYSWKASMLMRSTLQRKSEAEFSLNKVLFLERQSRRTKVGLIPCREHHSKCCKSYQDTTGSSRLIRKIEKWKSFELGEFWIKHAD